jgi:uncharacterized cofD-like protein
MKRVVTLGGGSGQYSVLRALSRIQHIGITAVVSVADSGKSSGRLRDQYSVLPPGDILKAIVALSQWDPSMVRDILTLRFSAPSPLDGHSVGNLLLTLHAKYAREQQHPESFVSAIQHLSGLLCVKEHAKVLPVCLDPLTVKGFLQNGECLVGEHAIDTYRGDVPFTHISLEPKEHAMYSVAMQEIKYGADVVIVSPGSLHSSLLPVLQVAGMKQSLVGKKLWFVCNTMTVRGDSDHLNVITLTEKLEYEIGRDFDCVFVDMTPLPDTILHSYRSEGAQPLRLRETSHCSRFVPAQLVTPRESESIRHDEERLANLLQRELQGI